MIRKLIIFCFILATISNISFTQTAKFRLGVQYNPELYKYSSTQFNNTTFDYETNFETNLNTAFTAIGSISITDRIWINLGVCYIKRTFSTLEGFNHCLPLKPGQNCQAIYIMSSQQDYHFLEYPFGLSIYLLKSDKRIRPKVIGNIIGKQLINIKCHFSGREVITEKQFQFYGIASNVGVGFDYVLNDKITFGLNCLYRFYNLRRELPILYGDNDIYFNDNKGILNSTFGIIININ